jgi:hypothetical protein
MKFDELLNRVIGNWTQDYWSRPMSSALHLFVSFVVKQFCASARGTSFLFALREILPCGTLVRVGFMGTHVFAQDS